MRIESMNNGTNYQPQQTQKVHGSGSDTQVTEQKTKQSTVKSMEKTMVEAEIAAEKRKIENESEVIHAIERANKHIRTFDRRLEFSIHDSTKQIMVKVINTEDDSVIREIPSEKVLDMVAHMWEVAGILVDEKR